MNAEDFYEQFKEVLRFLGPGWADKKLIKVTVRKGKIILTYGDLEASIKVNKKRDPKQS